MLSIHNWGFDFLCNTDSRVTLTLFKNNIDYKLCKVKVDRDSDYDISKIFFFANKYCTACILVHLYGLNKKNPDFFK